MADILLYILIAVFLAAIIAIFVFGSLETRYKKEKERADQDIADLERQSDSKVQNLISDREKECDQVKARYRVISEECEEQFRKEAAAYNAEFEKKSIEMAAGMMGSDLVKQFADRAAARLQDKITHADRDGFLEMIEVPLTLSVFQDKIRIDEEEPILFVKERINPIEEPLKINAVTQAIALQTRLDVEAAYPESPSGTIPSVEYTTSIGDDNASMHMVYREPNGRYQVKRSF